MLTAGPTQEAIDPVRYITNHSSGKMGYAIAKMARLRGAQVTLVSGPVNIKPFCGVDVVPVKSAADMFEAVTSRSAEADVVIMCSAVADYTPAVYADQKVKKHDGDLQIELKRTQDILGWLGEHKPTNQTLVGFSVSIENPTNVWLADLCSPSHPKMSWVRVSRMAISSSCFFTFWSE